MTSEKEQTAASLVVSKGAGSPHSGKVTSQVEGASNLLVVMAAQKEACGHVVLGVDKPGDVTICRQPTQTCLSR